MFTGTSMDWEESLKQSQQDLAKNLANFNTIPSARLVSEGGFLSRSMFDSSYRASFTDGGIYSNYGNGKSEKEKNKVGVKVLEKIKAAAKPFKVTDQEGEQAISKADEYRALGLEKMAQIVEYKSKRILREIGISAAGYKRINRSELNSFQKDLDQVSDMASKRRLLETPLAYYIGQNTEVEEGMAIVDVELGVPPQDVLEKLKAAKESKLFDDFAVLHIQRVPDPILCGKIRESDDLYFIAEWGDDVKLTDIVK